MKSFFTSVVVLGTCFAGGSAWAAAFGVDIHSARATGMATATKGHIDDASSVFYNPAGLVNAGKVLDVQLGDTLIIPSVSYTNLAGASIKTTSQVVPPPNFYVSYGITDQVSAGIGEFSPYGLVVDWPSDWDGRFQVQHVELKTYFLNPSVAVRVHDRVRLGAGLDIIRVTATLNRAIDFRTAEAGVLLGAGGWALGGNGGIQVDVVPNMLAIGATYRTSSTIDLKGKAHFTNVPVEFQSSAHDGTGMTTVHLPNTGGIGVAYRPIPDLRLAFDADYNGWQQVQDLTITFTDPNTSGTFLPKRWKHVWNYHLGGEYNINQQWRARAGILYDPTPSPNDTITPDLPDANRVNLAAGLGYRWSNFTADLAYMIVIITSNTSTAPTLPGTYQGTANIIGLSLGWRGDLVGMMGRH